MRNLPLLALLLALAACGARPAAPAPTPSAPTAPAPAAVLLPTVSSPTALPPSATALPPTALPPSATALPPSATALPPTSAPSATALPPTAAPPSATALPPTSAPAASAPNVAALPAPRGDAAAPVRLSIPAIGLDRELLSVGLDRNRIPVVPNHDVGWYNLSARPGQGENIVLWGHVLRFKATPNIPAPFARVRELPVGARLTLYSADGTPHPYEVVEQVWATPDQVRYILPQGRELLTLVSCIGDKIVDDGSVEMSHRLITIAAPAGQ